MDAPAPASDGAPARSGPESPELPGSDTLPMPAEAPSGPPPKTERPGPSRGPGYPGSVTGFGTREARRTGMFVTGAILAMVLIAAGFFLFALGSGGPARPSPARPGATASQSASPGASGHSPAGSGPAGTASPATAGAGG